MQAQARFNLIALVVGLSLVGCLPRVSSTELASQVLIDIRLDPMLDANGDGFLTCEEILTCQSYLPDLPSTPDPDWVPLDPNPPTLATTPTTPRPGPEP
jgi:hypothetical protein